jgi:SH3-like domain-containing protein
LFLLLLVALPARAVENNEDAEGATSGLPIPRFVSLGADRVNARTGPGERYPISWVYVRRALPVEVIAEFELYRKIRDQEGTEGWVHKRLLSGRRSVLISGTIQPLYRTPDHNAPIVLQAEPGVQGRLIRAKGDWCEVEIAGRHGFIERRHLYGVLPTETFE